MGTLDTVQQEQLRAIGSYLSQVRQEQERSLEDIAAKTYIPLRLLKAIEAGQDRPLPEPVFIQGFIRRYADALGLDGTDLSQRFPVHVTPLPVVTAVSSNQELQSVSEASYSHTQSEDEFRSVRSARRSPRSTNFLPYIAAAALLGLGGIALAVVRAISSRQPDAPTRSAVVLPSQPPVNASPETPTPAASPSPTSPTAVSPAPTSPQAQSLPTASPSPNSSSPNTSSSPRASSSSTPSSTNAPVNVKLNLTDESWVQVIVDGEVKAEAVLPRGTQQSWSGNREIVILAGNAGAVSVSHNGGTAQKMGALGDVTEKTFTAKSPTSGSAPSTNSTTSTN
ncbi:MAG: helix-turn-helix domain-containing protein [Leptolyngbya sp. IPPAS B-1204]|nr:MAG: DUF4115 domain-containing protein [Leptolyngbya sp. IPPAS B-1204]